LGTAHAVSQAASRLNNWRGDLLVTPGDAPCLQTETLKTLIRNHQSSDAVATVLTADLEDPTGYGRILRRGKQVVGIREQLDASRSEQKIREVSSGIYLFNSRALFDRLRHVKRNVKKKEFYLTDVVEAFSQSGERVRAQKITDAHEILGVNTREHLAKVHQVITKQELKRHSGNGVTILDPAHTTIAKGARIGRDTVVHPYTWIEKNVQIGKRCEIGPFAKIRSQSKIADRATIGSYVEIVRSTVGKKTNVKHLSYLGDARVGERVNVGAGSITANYDGKRKQKTVIGNGVFLGCNTVLVAPVTMTQGSKTGAGAVVQAKTRVPKGATLVGVPARVLKRKKKRNR
jgi:bifunctional UDP-N-acetylglucosamine pyrophosphorylase / glucosamine-1-phosphate N-acetyltransferase